MAPRSPRPGSIDAWRLMHTYWPDVSSLPVQSVGQLLTGDIDQPPPKPVAIHLRSADRPCTRGLRTAGDWGAIGQADAGTTDNG